MKKVYVLTEMSSGEECRLSLDQTRVFTTWKDVVEKLAMDYNKLIKDISGYGEITQDVYDGTYYSVILEEDDSCTIYEGCIQELDVEY